MTAASSRLISDRERFVAFAFAAADLLVEVGPDGRIAFAAGAFRARLGRAPDDLIGSQPVELVTPEDRGAFAAALSMLPARGRLAPTAFRLANSARTPFSVSGLHLLATDQEARLCLAFAPLPGPPDHRPAGATALLQEAERRLRHGTSSRLSLLEVEGLSEAAAQRIDGLLTREASPGSLAARIAPGRYGLLTEVGSAAPDLAGLARAVEDALALETHALHVATSAVDIAAGQLTPSQAARALRYGLGAFARFGADGLRGAGFEGGLGGVVAKITERAGALRRTIADRRFRLDFQPIVDLATREVHHHEALLRPEPGVLGPGEGPQDFVMLAETIGLTEDLDLAVAGLALGAALAVPKGRHVAFNISGLSAQSTAFRSRLLALLDSNRRAAERVMVELTESAEIDDEATASETLRMLRERGVPVCIDDFGAGAAAFRYLKAFQVDYVKVDGAFVTAAMTSERDRSFVAAMVDLSLAVGARIVAERVEDEDTAQAMQSLGVHYGQGWYFGKPGPL